MRRLGAGLYGAVRALAVYNAQLIASGDFAGYVAGWDGVDWGTLGSGMYLGVLALTVYNNDLIAGGYFLNAGGQSANFIARWNGAAWQPLGSGLDSYVFALAVRRNELIAGGNFTRAGGNVSAHWARGGPDCTPGDLNGDGFVDFDDFNLFADCMAGPGVRRYGSCGACRTKFSSRCVQDPFAGGVLDVLHQPIGGPGVDVTFPPVKAHRIRLAITESVLGPTIWDFALYPPR